MKRFLSAFLVLALMFTMIQVGIPTASATPVAGYMQLVTPNPNIPCTPGWCLMYVRQTFRAPAVEPDATTAWNNTQYKHRDMNFPDGCYVPIWFSHSQTPAGHVALLCPDGSVYSSSSATSTTPTHHTSIAKLMSYYGGTLTYLGWSEDISLVRVVKLLAIPLPTNATISMTKTTISVGENVTFNFKADNATGYSIGIDKDSTRIQTKDLAGNTSYSRSFSEPGNYSAYISASNSSGNIDSARVFFTIIKSPGAPSLSTGKSTYNLTEGVNFLWGATSDTTNYDLRILQNGNIIHTKYSIVGTNYSIKMLPGNYTAYLCSVNANYTDLWTRGNTISFNVILTAPSNFKAVSTNCNSIKLTWNTVAGASGYGIYRSTSAFGTYSFLTTATTNSFTNTKLVTGSAYYYKIKAYRAVGTTRVYGNQTIGVGARPVTAAPTNFKAASLNYNSIKLTWDLVAGASGYGIYRSTSALGTYSFLTTATTNSYTNTKLLTGSTYYYRIKAYRAIGTIRVYGNQTGAVSAKILLLPIKSISAARNSVTSIKISWAAISGASGYEIYRSTSSIGTYSLIKATIATYFTNIGLVSAKYYYYKVRAYRWVGLSKVNSTFSAVKYAKP